MLMMFRARMTAINGLEPLSHKTCRRILQPNLSSHDSFQNVSQLIVAGSDAGLSNLLA